MFVVIPQRVVAVFSPRPIFHRQCSFCCYALVLYREETRYQYGIHHICTALLTETQNTMLIVYNYKHIVFKLD